MVKSPIALAIAGVTATAGALYYRMRRKTSTSTLSQATIRANTRQKRFQSRLPRIRSFGTRARFR